MLLCGARDLFPPFTASVFIGASWLARRLGKTRVFSANESIGVAQCTLLQAIK